MFWSATRKHSMRQIYGVFWFPETELKPNRYAKPGFRKQPMELFCKRTCSLKFCKTHRKTPVTETVAQVFSCEFYEISESTFSYRTSLGECFWVLPISISLGKILLKKSSSNVAYCYPYHIILELHFIRNIRNFVIVFFSKLHVRFYLKYCSH